MAKRAGSQHKRSTTEAAPLQKQIIGVSDSGFTLGGLPEEEEPEQWLTDKYITTGVLLASKVPREGVPTSRLTDILVAQTEGLFDVPDPKQANAHILYDPDKLS